jgi:hypothetical protein
LPPQLITAAAAEVYRTGAFIWSRLTESNEGDPMKTRQLKAVRMFEHALRLLPKCDENMSGKTGGKLMLSLQNYCRRLKALAEGDPEQLFWPTLQKANLKLIKYVLHSKH